MARRRNKGGASCSTTVAIIGESARHGSSGSASAADATRAACPAPAPDWTGPGSSDPDPFRIRTGPDSSEDKGNIIPGTAVTARRPRTDEPESGLLTCPLSSEATEVSEDEAPEGAQGNILPRTDPDRPATPGCDHSGQPSQRTVGRKSAKGRERSWVAEWRVGDSWRTPRTWQPVRSSCSGACQEAVRQEAVRPAVPAELTWGARRPGWAKSAGCGIGIWAAPWP